MSANTYIPAQDDALFAKLKKMCVPDYFSSDSPVLRPFAIELSGEPWVAFTEGHVMVAVEGKREGVEPYTGKHSDNLRRTLELLTPTRGTWRNGVSLPALRDWVDVSKVGKCPVCEGTGLERDDLSDEEIDRRINDGSPLRPGILFGLIINRELIALPLAYLKADTVDVFVPDTDKAPFVISAEGWRILLMPVTGDGEGLDSFPNATHGASALP